MFVADVGENGSVRKVLSLHTLNTATGTQNGRGVDGNPVHGRDTMGNDLPACTTIRKTVDVNLFRRLELHLHRISEKESLFLAIEHIRMHKIKH